MKHFSIQVSKHGKVYQIIMLALYDHSLCSWHISVKCWKLCNEGNRESIKTCEYKYGIVQGWATLFCMEGHTLSLHT